MKDIILQDILDYILTCKDINKLRQRIDTLVEGYIDPVAKIDLMMKKL